MRTDSNKAFAILFARFGAGTHILWQAFIKFFSLAQLATFKNTSCHTGIHSYPCGLSGLSVSPFRCGVNRGGSRDRGMENPIRLDCLGSRSRGCYVWPPFERTTLSIPRTRNSKTCTCSFYLGHAQRVGHFFHRLRIK